jgi:serine/threonine protein kinase
MPLKTNENDDLSRINNINVTNITPNINYSDYAKMTELNNISLYNHNSNISDLSSDNYYYNYINDYPNSYIINQFHKNNIYQNQNTTIDIQNKNRYNENHRKNRFENNYFNGFNINSYEPSDDFNIAEFIIINLIGQGTFGKIYCVQWIKNNKLYAMKKLELQSSDELKEFQNKVKMIKNLYKKTNHSGFIRILGDKMIPLYDYKCYCNYYIVMELGERDWEKEIQLRFLHQKYYSEYELLQIIYQLVKTLSLMQRYNVSHRDIKPQNILIINGIYKICDFGEARIIEGNGLVIQHVRGSQLYMSPILFYAYNHNASQVLHNTYKSDVFSLGMCLLLAATLSGYTLYDIREILDINTITKIIFNTLNKRYSKNIINLIIKMLQIDENLRMDFIELEKYISHIVKK